MITEKQLEKEKISQLIRRVERAQRVRKVLGIAEKPLIVRDGVGMKYVLIHFWDSGEETYFIETEKPLPEFCEQDQAEKLVEQLKLDFDWENDRILYVAIGEFQQITV